MPQFTETQKSAPHAPLFWRPFLPEEIQREIALFAISSVQSDCSIDVSVAGTLRQVNSTWCYFVSPPMFTRIYLSCPKRYAEIGVYAANLNDLRWENHASPIRYGRSWVISAIPEPEDFIDFFCLRFACSPRRRTGRRIS